LIVGRSLRGGLLRVGFIAIVLAALLAAWLLGRAFEATANRAFERALSNDFAALAGLIEAKPDGRVELRAQPADQRYFRPLSGDYWQIGAAPSALRSRSLWDAEIVLPPDIADGRRELLRVPGPSKQRLRVLRQQLTLPRANAPVVVWVAADEAALRADVAAFRLLVAGAVGLLAALLLAALFVQVQLGLRPLRALSAALNQLQKGEQGRLSTDALPVEIQPLAAEFNALMDHHARSIVRAKNAASDLAHALKTPLAVLDAAVQQPDPAVQLSTTVREQSARIQHAMRRQLTSTALADFQARTPIEPVARTLAALMAHVYAERHLQIAIELPLHLNFRGAQDDLEEILGNLLDNACKWAHQKACVGGKMTNADLQLWVDDDGPGLSGEQIERVSVRGVRLDQRVQGSGLGLSIVQGLVGVYGGQMQLQRSDLGGLRVLLCFAAKIAQH